VSETSARDAGKVKEGAMLGASEECNGQPRLIGILPSVFFKADYVLGTQRLFLHTGLPHNVRNVLNSWTPDVVVAFGGSSGTLAEIAFASARGTPVIFARDSLYRLRSKLEEHFGRLCPQDERRKAVTTYFEEPLKTYPDAAGAASDGENLLFTLAPLLSSAKEETNLPAALGAILDGLCVADKPTGFLGVPGWQDARERFETIVAEISK
jgi:hypothetical protein